MRPDLVQGHRLGEPLQSQQRFGCARQRQRLRDARRRSAVRGPCCSGPITPSSAEIAQDPMSGAPATLSAWKASWRRGRKRSGVDGFAGRFAHWESAAWDIATEDHPDRPPGPFWRHWGDIAGAVQTFRAVAGAVAPPRRRGDRAFERAPAFEMCDTRDVARSRRRPWSCLSESRLASDGEGH